MAGARRFVATNLNAADCPSSCVEAATLLVSELATNAVLHAGTTFSVGLVRQDHTVTIEVADTAPGGPTAREPDSTGGRGLQILTAVAAEWGVRQAPDGKAVFFRVPC